MKSVFTVSIFIILAQYSDCRTLSDVAEINYETSKAGVDITEENKFAENSEGTTKVYDLAGHRVVVRRGAYYVPGSKYSSYNTSDALGRIEEDNGNKKQNNSGSVLLYMIFENPDEGGVLLPNTDQARGIQISQGGRVLPLPSIESSESNKEREKIKGNACEMGNTRDSDEITGDKEHASPLRNEKSPQNDTEDVKPDNIAGNNNDRSEGDTKTGRIQGNGNGRRKDATGESNGKVDNRKSCPRLSLLFLFCVLG